MTNSDIVPSLDVIPLNVFQWIPKFAEQIFEIWVVGAEGRRSLSSCISQLEYLGFKKKNQPDTQTDFF